MISVSVFIQQSLVACASLLASGGIAAHRSAAISGLRPGSGTFWFTVGGYPVLQCQRFFAPSLNECHAPDLRQPYALGAQDEDDSGLTCSSGSGCGRAS